MHTANARQESFTITLADYEIILASADKGGLKKYKNKGLVYLPTGQAGAESFTIGGEEFVPRRVTAITRPHVLTPHSLSLAVDFDLVSK